MDIVFPLCVSLFLLAWAFLARIRSRSDLLFGRMLVAFSFVVRVRYLWWRVFFTRPDFDSAFLNAFGYLLLLLDAFVVYVIIVELPFFLKARKADLTPVVDEHLDWYATAPPRVDILIPTYDEPWPVIERTLVGAKHQSYPNSFVWILDDGSRAWLRDKADAEGVGYVSRAGNEHFKAGNLNHAISHIRGRGVHLEFIALLDADFVARPEFVRRAMALMADDAVAVVQTPQWYYNPDPFQRAYGGQRAWPDDVRQWYDEVQPRREATGNPLCAGTSCVLRMKALDAIGGFPTESVSEDSLCSIKLKKKNWRTRYLNECLSVGLAPEGLEQFLSQRSRWQRGWIEINRFFGRPTRWSERPSYWLSFYRGSLLYLHRFSWNFVALVYLFGGVWLLRAPAPEVLGYFVPLWLERCLYTWLYGGRKMIFVSDAPYVAQGPTHVATALAALIPWRRKQVFGVTKKAVTGTSVHWSTLAWSLPLALLLGLGVAHALLRPASVRDVHLLGIALGVYLNLQLVSIIVPAIQGPNRRSDERYATRELVFAREGDVRRPLRCRDISVGGVLVDAPKEGIAESIVLEVDGVGAVQARLARRARNGALAYVFADPRQRPYLIRKILCGSEYVPIPSSWTPVNALFGFLRGVMPRWTRLRV